MERKGSGKHFSFIDNPDLVKSLKKKKYSCFGSDSEGNPNWVDNKVSISIEGEDYKQEPKSYRKQNISKESYDNILIMESTDSIAKVNKTPSYAILDKMDKIDEARPSWSEGEDEDTLRRDELPKL